MFKIIQMKDKFGVFQCFFSRLKSKEEGWSGDFRFYDVSGVIYTTSMSEKHQK